MTATPSRKPTGLVFMGTPPFAATILAALIEAGHQSSPSTPNRLARLAEVIGHNPHRCNWWPPRHKFTIRSPVSLRIPEAHAAFAGLGAEAAVVAAYGLILPPAILRAPRLGCLNVHASLLPRWRGAAPIQRALLAGDTVTGVTIMQMDEGVDTGAILMQQAVLIAPGTTAAGLSSELAVLGSRLVLAALDGVADGTLVPQPQPQEGVTYARKIEREDGRLDWRQTAASLERQVRALDPWPGAI